MGNVVLIGILVIIVAGIIAYLIREKKKGKTCIGCPYAGACANAKKGGCESGTSQSS